MNDNIFTINDYDIDNISVKQDGSYVVIKNGLPFHIVKESEEHDFISKKILEQNIKVRKYVIRDYTPTANELAEQIRTKRDILLEQADKLLIRYEEELEIGIIEQNDTYRKALLRYKCDLRNIPQQEGFPENIEWPELPAGHNV